MDFLAVNQKRISYGINRVGPGLGGMVVDLDWNAARMAVSRLDLDTEHNSVPNFLPFVAGQA